MEKNTKILIGVGVLAVIGLLFIPKIRKMITDSKIRKDTASDGLDENYDPLKDPNVVKPGEVKSSKGKTVYAKPKSEGGAGYVNVRSGAYVDNGGKDFRSNFIGMVVEGKPIGKVLEGNIYGEGKVWYKITVNSSVLQDSKELGLSAKKSATEGYVREDNVIIK